MLRTVKNPNDWDGYPTGLPFNMGGLGTESANEALSLLNAVSESSIAQSQGLVNILADDTVDQRYFGNIMIGSDMVDGDQSIMVGQTKEWFLTSYDCFVPYDLIALAGSVSIERNVIRYTAPSVPGISGFTVNGKFVPVLITIDDLDPTAPVLGFVNKPTVVTPIDFDAYIEGKATIRTTSFSAVTTVGTDTHASTDWQIATDAGFVNIVKLNNADTVNKAVWSVTNLTELATYYVRARHRGTVLGASEWSNTVSFIVPVVDTATGVIAKPSVVSEVVLDQLAGNITFNASAFAFTISDGTETHTASSWEVSANSSFTGLLASIYDSIANRLSWTSYGLPVDTPLYVRTKQIGLRLPESAWSDPKAFTIVSGTLITGTIAKAVITEPLVYELGTVGVATASTSAFSYVISDGTENHVSSDWEVSTTPSFSNIVLTNYNSTADKVSWRMTGLNNDTQYYLRVRHKGGILPAGEWSNAVAFQIATPAPVISGPTTVYNQVTYEYTITNYYAAYSYTTAVIGSGIVTRSADKIYYTPSAGGSGGFTVNGLLYSVTVVAPSIATPSILTPANGATGQRASIFFTSSAFAVVNSTDTHVSSSWQMATDPGFTNIVASVAQSATDKTTWTATGLMTNTTYYVRVRHHGAAYGASAWSSAITVTTRSSFYPLSESAVITFDGTHSLGGPSPGLIGTLSGSGNVLATNGAAYDSTDTLVYIHRVNSGTWSIEGKIKLRWAADLEVFPISIALNQSGDIGIFGIPAWGLPGTILAYQGYYAVFSLNAGVWSIVHDNTGLGGSSINRTQLAQLGYSVDINDSGDTIAVSMPAADSYDYTYPERIGRVFIRRKSAGVWGTVSEVHGNEGEHFGWSVSLSGDGLSFIVAERGHQEGSIRVSKVYYYASNDGTSYTLKQTLQNTAWNNGTGVKAKMSKDGKRLFVFIQPLNKVYYYKLVAGVWVAVSSISTPCYSFDCNYTGDLIVTGGGYVNEVKLYGVTDSGFSASILVDTSLRASTIPWYGMSLSDSGEILYLGRSDSSNMNLSNFIYT